MITKVPLSDLRLRKIVVSGYIDDFFTKDHTSESCFNNVMSIAELFDRLGFVFPPDKSVLIPTQEITISGFEINSRKMSVKLTPQKEKNLKRLVNQLFSMKIPSIRFRYVSNRYNCLSFSSISICPLVLPSTRK